MAWCRKTTRYYPILCWPRFILPYRINRPQCINLLRARSFVRNMKIWLHFLLLLDSETWRAVEKRIHGEQESVFSTYWSRTSCGGAKRGALLRNIRCIFLKSVPLHSRHAWDAQLFHRVINWITTWHCVTFNVIYFCMLSEQQSLLYCHAVSSVVLNRWVAT